MNYQEYYTNQIGHGQLYYKGRRYQKGHGLGNVLGTLFRSALPFLKKTAVSVGKDVLKSGVTVGSHALTDIVSGAPVKQSIKRRFVHEGRELVNKRLKPNTIFSDYNCSTHKHKKKRIIRRRIVAGNRSKDIFS